MMKRPSIFLSSTFRDSFNEIPGDIPLRRRILETAETSPVEILAYELMWPDEEIAIGADEIIDRCFAGIRSCDLFVFILTGRHGSGASLIDGDPTVSSYLELELFAAAVLGKPIAVLHYQGREPEPQLLDALLLLRRAFRSEMYFIDSEQGLFDRWNEVTAALADSRFGIAMQTTLLPEGLSRARTTRRHDIDLQTPHLLFLGGNLQTKHSNNPNRLRAELLLNQAESGVRGAQPLPHGAALFRLWSAMRELLGTANIDLNDPPIARLWDRALGLWAAKASWFGLHGHLWMGPLAAINSQTALRKQHGRNSEFAAKQEVREPVGAKASAVYSIAKRMRTRGRKFYHFRQAVTLASEAMLHDENAAQGAVSIRAHSLMQMGRLGHVWKLWEAKTDFQVSLRLREQYQASEASIGESKSDLGFCCILTGQPRVGIALLREGVNGLRCNVSANGQAFLARGLKKLEMGAKLAGYRKLSLEAREERLSLAQRVEALDQSHSISVE